MRLKCKITVVRIGIIVLSFLFLYGMVIILVFGTDRSNDSLDLFSYTATLEEYRNAIPGLHYRSQRHDATANPMEPQYLTISELFSRWHPDDVSVEKWPESSAHPDSKVANGAHALQRFDYSSPEDMKLAKRYRDKEIPFVLYNIKELDAASEDVFTIPSLVKKFGSAPIIVEKAIDNHYMYYTMRTSIDSKILYSGWQPPQSEVPMTFSRFLRLAMQAEEKLDAASNSVSPTHYFTINAGEGGRTEWLTNALPFFSPLLREESFMVVDPDGYKGINCRYGMKGVTAAAHYDGRRNFVAMIKGRKRYVLLPPRACSQLSLLPKGHPSARHSYVDWSSLVGSNHSAGKGEAPNDSTGLDEKKEAILRAPATEYLLSRGEVLYIPSYWFHYIVSQDASIQCNARSGDSNDEEARTSTRKCMNKLQPYPYRTSSASSNAVGGHKSDEHTTPNEVRGMSGLVKNFQERSKHFRALDPQWTLDV